MPIIFHVFFYDLIFGFGLIGKIQIDKLKALYNEYSFKPIPTKVTFLLDNDGHSSSSIDVNDPESSQPKTLKISYRVRDTYQVKTTSFHKLFVYDGSSGYKSIGLPEDQSEYVMLSCEC